MTFYRLLLHLYPRSFRREYEHELTAAFAARTLGQSRLTAALAGIADVVPNAVAAHGEILVRDLRYAARSLRRSPGFAITTILVVALGVGANTATFSLADFVLLRPLPFRNPDQLVRVWQGDETGYNQLSPAKYRDWKEAQHSFAEMGAFVRRSLNLIGSGEPRQLDAVMATPDFFRTLGVAPIIGRPVTSADENAGGVAVISYGLWQSQFAGDPNIIGRVVQLQGAPHTILGVMPPTFHYPSRDVEVWTGLFFRGQDYEDRDDTYVDCIARLREGVSLNQARRDMGAVVSRIESAFAKQGEQSAPLLMFLRDEISARARLLVLALCGAALCILLLACANLASLFLARATHRMRELAVRTALGAGQEQIIRQLVTESLGLGLLGFLAGVAAARLVLPLLTRLVPSGLPVANAPTIDLRVLLFAGALMTVAGLIFGVGPAFAASHSTTIDSLRSGTRTSGGATRRLRSGLVVVEIAASAVLLILSGLLIRSVWNIQAIDPGFRADGVLAVRTALPRPKYDFVAKRVQYYDRVLGEVRALPGVQSAAFITGLPMLQRGGIWTAEIPGAPKATGTVNASSRFVTPGFFSTMRIPLVRGRDIAESDAATSPYVLVVSESFVKKLWPNEDGLGKVVTFAGAPRTIVGVVGDIRFRGLEQASEPQAYVSYKQLQDSSYYSYDPKELVVRSETPPTSLVPAVRSIVRAADAEQPIAKVRTMATVLGDETASRVTQLRLLVTLAVIGLLIAGVGIHGLLSFTVSRRTQELGVRRALGAQVPGITGLVVGEGMRLAAIGVAMGVGVAYLSARTLGSLLNGVEPNDPLTIATSVTLCLVIAAFGCARPAIRAARVDPLTALRAE